MSCTCSGNHGDGWGLGAYHIGVGGLLVVVRGDAVERGQIPRRGLAGGGRVARYRNNCRDPWQRQDIGTSRTCKTHSEKGHAWTGLLENGLMYSARHSDHSVV
jgi:hypothetical protein